MDEPTDTGKRLSPPVRQLADPRIDQRGRIGRYAGFRLGHARPVRGRPTKTGDLAAYDPRDDRRMTLVLAEPSGVQELALQVLCGVSGGGTLLPGREEKLAQLGRVHFSEGDGW